MFSSDVVATMEKYGTDMVNSVMQRAEAVYRNFHTNVYIYLFIYFCSGKSASACV